MATTNTAGTKLPKTDKTTKSAKKSAQTLKTAPVKKTTSAKVKAAAASAAPANVIPLKRDEVVAQIETLKADLAQLTSQLKDAGVEYVDVKTADVRAAAVEKATVAKDVAVEKAEYAKGLAIKNAELAKDKYAELAADTEARIRQNPLTAVAIAAGVGLLFGAVSRR